jgi:hypothetical protein
MHDEVYTDGVDEITVSGTIVRIDLFTLSPTERDAGNFPKKVFRQRLILSAEGFANSVDVMQNALQGLVDAGVVKRTRSATPPQTPPLSPGSSERPATSSTSQRPSNASTNFR